MSTKLNSKVNELKFIQNIERFWPIFADMFLNVLNEINTSKLWQSLRSKWSHYSSWSNFMLASTQ